jgi:glycine/D-amino acid oxidase-like deaminating enzyme
MKVVVLGGGVIGVCTAYYLARSGVDVMLLEAGAEVAGATSYANAGQIVSKAFAFKCWGRWKLVSVALDVGMVLKLQFEQL